MVTAKEFFKHIFSFPLIQPANLCIGVYPERGRGVFKPFLLMCIRIFKHKKKAPHNRGASI
jgi:hypothetical protein